MSKPGCLTCSANVRTWAESRWHLHFHRTHQCGVCKRKIGTADAQNHVYSCLLRSGTLSTKDLLAYMRPCSVRLVKSFGVSQGKKSKLGATPVEEVATLVSSESQSDSSAATSDSDETNKTDVALDDANAGKFPFDASIAFVSMLIDC